MSIFDHKPTFKWLGLTFSVYSKEDDLPSAGGLYILCATKTDALDRSLWSPLYEGRSEDLVAQRTWPIELFPLTKSGRRRRYADFLIFTSTVNLRRIVGDAWNVS